MEKTIRVLDVKLDALNISSVVEKIERWILFRDRETSRYVCVTNVNSVVVAQKDPYLKKITNESDISVCDGMPLVWMANLKGVRLKERVYGFSLMHELLRRSQVKGYSHYFYGTTEAALGKMISKIKTMYPRLKIAGYYAPPFRELTAKEKVEVIKKINDSKADIVWVGIGYPKQEIWMYEFKDSIKSAVLLGVGAAFDFMSGNKPQAPLWMQNSGLEWLFRLSCEPKRLWKRYLISNTLFILALPRELGTFKLFQRFNKLPKK